MELTSPSRTPDIQAIKCGVKFQPPAVILLYKDGGKGKQRLRSMPLRGFSSTTNVSTYIEELQDGKNRMYFNSIPQTQLFSLLERMKLGQKCGSTTTDKTSTDIGAGLSSLPPLVISNGSEQRRVGHNIASLSRSSAAESAKELYQSLELLLNSSDVSQEDSPRSEKKEMPTLKKTVSPLPKDQMPLFTKRKETLTPIASVEKKLKAEDSAKDSVDMDDIAEGKKLDIDQLLDLNKATLDELDRKKSEMDVLFEANRVKPGDPNYQYDMEIDFDLNGKVECTWDSDHSHSDF